MLAGFFCGNLTFFKKAAYDGDVNSLPSSDRQRAEKAVLEIIIDELKSGQMTVGDARQIARLMLEEAPKIDTNQRILELFSRLAQTHQAFKKLYIHEKSDSIKRRELAAWQEALELINQGKIDEAQTLVSQVMKEAKVG